MSGATSTIATAAQSSAKPRMPMFWREAFLLALPVVPFFFLIVQVRQLNGLLRLTPGQLLVSVLGDVAFGLILAAFLAACEITGLKGRARVAGYVVSSTLAALVALAVWNLFADTLGFGLPPAYLPSGAVFWVNWTQTVVENLIAIALCLQWRRARARAAGMRHIQQVRATMMRRTAEADLLAMQARIDPPFMFEMLEAIERAYEQPEDGRRLIDALIAYLRAALPSLDCATSTLGKECDLARGYLDLARERHALDLRVKIDFSEVSRTLPFPPMLVLPIIEDVVKTLIAQPRSTQVTFLPAVSRQCIVLSIEVAGYALSPKSLALVRARLSELNAGTATPIDSGVRLEIPYATDSGIDR